MELDFSVAEHGSIVIFTPLTEAARLAMEEMELESWQFVAEGFAVDRRVAWNLLGALLENGLLVG
jgi:hypothetical protein